MELPAGAPAWAASVIAALADAGFEVENEASGGMAGYALTMKRENLAVAISADRGQWYLEVVAPNPQRGRGHRRQVTTGVEVYMAALRDDHSPDVLLRDWAVREAEAAEWVVSNVNTLLTTYRDPTLWERVHRLQSARAKRLFG